MSEITIEMPAMGLVHEATTPAEREVGLAFRQTRGGEAQPDEIRSTVVLGGPDPARMAPRDGEDPALADRRAGSDFWSVLMSLTLEPDDAETLTSAWLRINLSTSPGGTPPIAFAMEPNRQEAGVELQAGGGAEINAQVLKVSGSGQRTYTLQEAEILALNRLRSDPAWEISPSTGRPIRGGTDFVLVVKAPSGTRGAGQVSFGAEIEWTTPGFMRSRRHEVKWAGDPVSFTLD